MTFVDAALDLRPRAGKDAAIDSQRDRGARIDEALDKEVAQAQPELVGRPLRAGEEVVGAGVVKAPGMARGLPHPADRALADAPEPAISASKVWKVGAVNAPRSRDVIAISEDGRTGIGGEPPWA